MLGAIIGDIVGSVYEWDNIRSKDFPFFEADCFFTDDTVMTIAVADALMRGGSEDDFIDALKEYGRIHPDAGFGDHFRMWMMGADRTPYNSYGNGSAMRVSPCAELAFKMYKSDYQRVLQEARVLAQRSARVTHNHPEGIKGAEATAYAIALAYLHDTNTAKERIRKEIPELFGYDLSKTLDEIRPNYFFDVSCQGTVPQAIIAFLESDSFEDAIRNAISLGGDSDTLAAITGSIAEASYGVPEWMEEKALTVLTDQLRGVVGEWKG